MDIEGVPLTTFIGCVPLITGLLLAEDVPLTVAWDAAESTIRTRGLVGRLDSAAFNREVRRTLGAAQITAGVLTSFATEKDRRRASPQGGSDCTYNSWRAAIDRADLASSPLRCPEMRQAIKLGNKIVVRALDTNCRRTQQLLQGATNPLRFALAGSFYELVDLVPSATRCTPDGPDCLTVAFYLKTGDDVTLNHAKETLLYLQELSGTPRASLVLRNDAWLVTHCRAPVILPLMTGSFVLPSNSDFMHSKEADCVLLSNRRISCYGVNLSDK